MHAEPTVNRLVRHFSAFGRAFRSVGEAVGSSKKGQRCVCMSPGQVSKTLNLDFFVKKLKLNVLEIFRALMHTKRTFTSPVIHVSACSRAFTSVTEGVGSPNGSQRRVYM